MRVRIPRLPAALAVAVLAAAIVGCSNTNKNKTDVGPPATMGAISGTITLPGTTPNQLLWIAVDEDSSYTNGYIKYDTMTTSDLLTFDYVIDNVPIGDYFVYGGVLVGHTDMPPRTDDLLGYYDTGLTPPSNPNVGVTANDTIDASFSVSEIP